eukprot:COSAG02_NODE_11745_length_1662_cov_11.658717_2_plen_69_part_00
MGPTDTNYYWQLVDASPTDPAGTAQYGASEFGELQNCRFTCSPTNLSPPLYAVQTRCANAHLHGLALV